VDREHGPVDDGFQREVFPGCALGFLDHVQEDGVGAIEESLCRGFEVGSLRIEYCQIEIWFQEAQDTVRFDDGVLRRGEDLADARHGFLKAPRLGADPPGVLGASDQKTRSVRLAGAVFFFYGPGMIGAGIIAGFAVGGADAVSVFSDFERRPVEAGQGGDETGDDAGLTDFAAVSADDENGHEGSS